MLLEVAPQEAVCSTKKIHQLDVRSRPCQQGKDWQHCATVSDGARLRCRSKCVEVRRRRVRVHQATDQNLTWPLSGPDRVQGSTGESCEQKPRRKRDESTNYGTTFQRSVGHRLGGRQRSDAFDVANDCKEATGRNTWKPRSGSGECSTAMQEQVSGNIEATGIARESLRDLTTVHQPSVGGEGWRRQVTHGNQGAARRPNRTERETDFQEKSRGEVITSLAYVMPAMQSNAKDKRATDGVWTMLLAPMTARTGPTHKAVTLYFSTYSQVKFSQTLQDSRVGIPVSDEHRHFAVNTLEKTC